MARTIKDPEVRRNEIIDVAQELFLTKGYENTSVQDILGGAGIAKGTFYHYFDSKMELLDSFVERLTDATLSSVEPIVDDEQMSAMQKLHAYFDTIMQWKTENRRFLMDLARVIYKDENAIYRQKMMSASLKRVAPMFAAIIEQGVEEGIYTTEYPAEISEIVFTIMRSLSESMVELLLDEDYEGDMAAAIERIIAAHEYAIARVLGFDGPFELIDVDAAKLWIEVRGSA